MSTDNKPAEGKRDEFRKYLERTGVMDALTKVLVALYEEAEKPENALEFIRKKLYSQSGDESIESLKAKLDEANQKISTLEKENEGLRGGDAAQAPPADPPAAEAEVAQQPEQ
ncbi:uncharacterized protein CBL_07580 [Carabus blaptoides fortunei]